LSTLVRVADRLAEQTARLRFGPPVSHVYGPLVYARAPFVEYVTKYGTDPREVVLLGMNPGPWGMAQTGIPFGTVSMVRDWLGIEAAVAKPPEEHPRRPVSGFACGREEISGLRLWGWVRSTFGTPARFFARFFVANYCPLAFLESTGRNRTPDKLPAAERTSLFPLCDEALRTTIEHLRPRWVIGVGQFAERRAGEALQGMPQTVGRIPHPSPASPGANRDWAGKVVQQLRAYGIHV